MVIFHSYAKLPEGRWSLFNGNWLRTWKDLSVYGWLDLILILKKFDWREERWTARQEKAETSMGGVGLEEREAEVQSEGAWRLCPKNATLIGKIWENYR